jgi:hypothetical protein
MLFLPIVQKGDIIMFELSLQFQRAAPWWSWWKSNIFTTNGEKIKENLSNITVRIEVRSRIEIAHLLPKIARNC